MVFVFGVTESLEARDSSCPRICPTQGAGDPVCGTDDIIYPNICELRKKTCGKGKKDLLINQKICLVINKS